jgi:hypothetical protein
LEIWKLVLANGLAYAIGYDWLAVIDVSDPAAPASRGSLSGFLLPTALAVRGEIAYVGDIFGLRLVDVSDVSAPVEVGSLALPGDAMSVAVHEDRAYVVSHVEFRHHLLHVIDVSNPAAPVELGFAELIESPRDVAVVPGRVFVVTLDGIRVFTVSEGGTLRELGAVTTPERQAAWQLDLSGGLVFGACEGDGLCIVDFGPEYAQLATIDVKPSDGRNRLNPKSGGRVAVAVLDPRP